MLVKCLFSGDSGKSRRNHPERRTNYNFLMKKTFHDRDSVLKYKTINCNCVYCKMECGNCKARKSFEEASSHALHFYEGERIFIDQEDFEAVFNSIQANEAEYQER